VQQSSFLESVHAIVERAHPREDHGTGLLERFGAVHNLHLRIHLEQRAMNAAQIPGTVIDQSNHRRSISGWPEKGNQARRRWRRWQALAGRAIRHGI